jgi:hypothetical protein
MDLIERRVRVRTERNQLCTPENGIRVSATNNREARRGVHGRWIRLLNVLSL